MFHSVVDCGSFAAAAVQLGIAPSTISKAIQRLEKQLGLQLFYRSTRKLALTQSGREYAKASRQFVLELEACEQRLQRRNQTPEGTLLINAPVSYGRLYLLPRLPAFHRQYPRIEIELSLNDGYVDMIENGIDLTIRSGQLEDSNLVAQQLTPMDFLICAAPSYLEQCSAPCTEAHFADHPWIRFRFRQTGRLMPIRTAGALYDPGQQWIVDDGEALTQLCIDGLGLTQIPHFLAKAALERQSIVPLLPALRADKESIWAIYTRRQFVPERIRVFIQFLRQQLEAQGEFHDRTWASELALWTPPAP